MAYSKTPVGFEPCLSPGLEPIANVISQRPEHANRQRSPQYAQQQRGVRALDKMLID